MKIFLALSVVLAIAMVQGNKVQDLIAYLKDYHNEYVVETMGGFEFYQHDRLSHKLLVAISKGENKSCHVLYEDHSLRKYLKEPQVQQRVIKEIYDQIVNNKANETEITLAKLDSMYKDQQLHENCDGHKIFDLKYTPSFPRPTYPPFISEPADDILDILSATTG